MAIYKVYHARKPTYGRRPHPHWPKGYELVAEVEATGLHEVFCLTQHLYNCFWPDNPGVSFSCRPVRSTSVGDVVVTPDGRAYRCAPVGWHAL